MQETPSFLGTQRLRAERRFPPYPSILAYPTPIFNLKPGLSFAADASLRPFHRRTANQPKVLPFFQAIRRIANLAVRSGEFLATGLALLRSLLV
ncbi:MAG: hypothetical protein GTO18_00175 [Anaerolineales bacterium]|nr:hypothetical protein [Anaerolineales bacterium]